MISIGTHSTHAVLMNVMASFNMRSLPVMSGAIDGIIKLPSSIDLKSSLSDEFRPAIKLDKVNTIISNLTANMAQKRIEDSDKIIFLFSYSSPVITTGANGQEPVQFAMKSTNMMRTAPIPN